VPLYRPDHLPDRSVPAEVVEGAVVGVVDETDGAEGLEFVAVDVLLAVGGVVVDVVTLLAPLLHPAASAARVPTQATTTVPR